MGWRLPTVGFEPTKKMILSSFGAGRGGSLVGGDRGGSWGGGVVRSRAEGGEWWGSRQKG